jgi:predicted GNAT family acetyltransferase
MELVHEEDNSRFVLVDGDTFVGDVTYEVDGDLMLLLSAEVPREIRGQGYGKILVRRTLEHLRDNGEQRVQPVCPFIAKFMMQNPEFQALRG